MDIKLPAHIHAQTLTGTTDTGSPLSWTIVWADRPTSVCPRCGGEVDLNPGCPFILDPQHHDGQYLVDVSQRHEHCGAWISVDHRQIQDATPEQITATAEKLSRLRCVEQAGINRVIRDQLRGELADAMQRLADGADPEDITTGSDTHPGVYRADTTWVAWGYAADGEDTITVTGVDPASAAPDTRMQMHELEVRLGEVRDELTDTQVQDILGAVHHHQDLPGYDPTDTAANATVLTAIVQQSLGKLDLAATGQAYRRSRATAEAYALGAVLAGMPEAQAARESTLDRMTIRRMLGKR
mgnify:CR=1 FL=1